MIIFYVIIFLFFIFLNGGALAKALNILRVRRGALQLNSFMVQLTDCNITFPCEHDNMFIKTFFYKTRLSNVVLHIKASSVVLIEIICTQ